MRFKIIQIVCSILALGESSFAEPSTMGVVIRPLFFENASKFFNSRAMSFPFDEKIGRFSLSGKLQFHLDAPTWNAHSANLLFLRTKLSNLKLEGLVVHESGNRYAAAASLTELLIRIVIDPQGISSQGPTPNLVSADLVAEPGNTFDPDLTISKEDTKEVLTDILSLSEIVSLKALMWSEIRKAVNEQFSNWIFDRLRRSVIVQPLSRVMEDSPLWKEGPIFKKGGLTIEMDGPALSKKETLFATYPFLKGNVFVTDSSLEFYSRATFVQSPFLDDLLGSRSAQLPLDQLALAVEERLRDPSVWDSESFTRPQLPAARSELSLVIPSTLVNEALGIVYREGLLRFKTRSHLGAQTKGLLTKEAPEVYSVVGISPLSAPAISFEADRTHLKIIDYSLDVSTDIEDRLIPSARILTNASVYAGLVVDSDTQTINLKMEPESFEMTLRDLSERLTPDQMSVFERLADSLWKEFLSSYSSLVLFTAPVETQKAGIKMVGVDVNQSTILLHINLDWESLKL